MLARLRHSKETFVTRMLWHISAVVISFLTILSFNSASAQFQQTFRSSLVFKDKLDLKCNNDLIKTSKMFATSTWQHWTPDSAALWGNSAWTASLTDHHQSLIIQFDDVKNVTSIATQGKPHTDEYVLEYCIQYSDDGKNWIDYKDTDGFQKIFRGNTDGDFVIRNDFDYSIVAKWIKINPTKWHNRISLRVELYGCDSEAETLFFDGNSKLQRDLTIYSVASLREEIRFRFRTCQANGIILYSQGSQGDYIVLQLVEARLLLTLNFGGVKIASSLALGSLLDDNIFHDVVISRNRRDLLMSVDRVEARDEITGDYLKLNLDDQFYFGGVPSLREGLHVDSNFKGCIQNLKISFPKEHAQAVEYFNYKENFIAFKNIGNVSHNCKSESRNLPITFKTEKSFLKITGRDNSSRINVSLEFRTFHENGLLLYHLMSSELSIILYLEEGRIKIRISKQNKPQIELDNFELTFNDGRWHSVRLEASKNFILLRVDAEELETRRFLEVSSGKDYIIGGGIYNIKGFLGCMRLITIDGLERSPSQLDESEVSSVEDFSFDACYLKDFCSPNPCQHGGICKQNNEDFFCECEGTGYTGAVCHTSMNFMSCVHYHNSYPTVPYTEIMIDLDLSGPLNPFPVRCEFFPDGRQVTYVGHANEEVTKVDGFDDKGSFQQLIYYDAPLETMIQLIERSFSCEQKLGYDCKRSRLLNTPVNDSDKFSPFGYWISRQNKIMDYWGGSLPGSFKCECGLFGVCFDPDKWCNCDSGHDDWLYDGGEIVDKQYLPVRALHFGDTGTPLDNKEGRYTLGPLSCDGDVLFDNGVTFRKEDAVIELPTLEMGLKGDIYFEFKTQAVADHKEMVMFQCLGDSGDYISVSLIGGNKIKFEFDSGKGPLSVTVEQNPGRLDDNNWHSVMIERNVKEAVLIVDRALKGQIKEPAGISRKMVLTSKLFIGANKDYFSGYVGCLRALMINGRMVDLVVEATKQPLYGISPGCAGKCFENPCKNGGTCVEGYDHFTCDCSQTPFRGSICTEEIGTSMNPISMIKYEFQNPKTTLNEVVRIGFTTSNPKGILLGAFSGDNSEFFVLSVNREGVLEILFDFGFGLQLSQVDKQNFKSGQFHEVLIERFDYGRSMRVKVDDTEPVIFNFDESIEAFNSVDVSFNNIQFLYIGRNSSSTSGFDGCISRVQFLDIFPLRLLFESGPSPNIQSLPGSMTENFCGIEPSTLPPEELETRPPRVYTEEDDVNAHRVPSSAYVVLVLSVLLLVLVASGIFIGRHLNRQKGEYVTREDEGAAEAFDADTAVLQSKTGHCVEKKREWFI